MRLSPVLVFKDNAVEGMYRCVNMQVGVHTFFSYACHKYTFLLLDFFRACGYS